MRKRSISIDVIGKRKSRNSKFRHILYFLKSNNDIIIENNTTGKISKISYFDLQKYLDFPGFTSDWKKGLNDRYCRINNGNLEESFRLFDNPRFVNISIKMNRFYNFNRKKIKVPKTENFKIEENGDKFIIHCKLPLFPVHINIINSMIQIYFNIDDTFYKFPYGNVNGDTNNLCIGSNNKILFKNTDEIYSNLVTTIFNDDYSLQVRGYEMSPLFDLKKIKKELTNQRPELSIISSLYYLSTFDCIEKLKDINMNIFIKTLKTPMGEPNE